MRTAFCLLSLVADGVFEIANRLDHKFNRVRREAEERAEYAEFLRTWTDGTDCG